MHPCIGHLIACRQFPVALDNLASGVCSALIFFNECCLSFGPGLRVLKLYCYANEHQEHLEAIHDDIIKWKHFPCNWPFVRGIDRSSVDFPLKGQWRGALMFSLICAWTNGWANTQEAGDLRCHCAHYVLNVTNCKLLVLGNQCTFCVAVGSPNHKYCAIMFGQRTPRSYLPNNFDTKFKLDGQFVLL